MEELDAFLESAMPRLMAADTTFHNGDAGPRVAIWSQHSL